MISGLYVVMVEVLGILEGYQKLYELVFDSSFDNDEIIVVWQMINVEYVCYYCVLVYIGIVKSMKVLDDIINVLWDEILLLNDKFEVLCIFIFVVICKCGEVSSEDLNVFYEVGYEYCYVFEVILVLFQKVMSNYVNYIVEILVDELFQKFVWKKVK